MTVPSKRDLCRYRRRIDLDYIKHWIPVRCINNEQHYIGVNKRGRMIALDHSDFKSEAVLAAMTNTSSVLGCIDFIRNNPGTHWDKFTYAPFDGSSFVNEAFQTKMYRLEHVRHFDHNWQLRTTRHRRLATNIGQLFESALRRYINTQLPGRFKKIIIGTHITDLDANHELHLGWTTDKDVKFGYAASTDERGDPILLIFSPTSTAWLRSYAYNLTISPDGCFTIWETTKNDANRSGFAIRCNHPDDTPELIQLYATYRRNFTCYQDIVKNRRPAYRSVSKEAIHELACEQWLLFKAKMLTTADMVGRYGK